MENAAERVCCQSLAGIIGGKFGSEKYITSTVAFQEVCLSRNVLEAALGTWRHVTEQPLKLTTSPTDLLRTDSSYPGCMAGWEKMSEKLFHHAQ